MDTLFTDTFPTVHADATDFSPPLGAQSPAEDPIPAPTAITIYADSTDSDQTGHMLSVKQLHAIDQLVLGKVDREVAEAVGVTRQTVCGWRLHNPDFRQALEARRNEIFNSSVDRMRSLVDTAIARVEKSLSWSDGHKTSLRLIQLAGLARACGDDAAHRAAARSAPEPTEA